MWGATRDVAPVRGQDGISIHAPRVGSDTSIARLLHCLWHFNPRSPCGERLGLGHMCVDVFAHFNPRSPCGERLPPGRAADQNTIFQSTLPVWGATKIIPLYVETISDFNPRSPCGERRQQRYTTSSMQTFQSTLPVWGATPLKSTRSSAVKYYFNPRSPCGERRLQHCSIRRAGKYFNPRSPCGERRRAIRVDV